MESGVFNFKVARKRAASISNGRVSSVHSKPNSGLKKIVILLGKSPVPVGEGLDEAFMQRQFAGHGSYGTAIELQEEGSMCRRQRANFLNGINGDISIEVDTSAPE